MTAPILAGARVMVVEDELLVCMLLEDLLEEHGCHTVGPYNGLAEALEAARVMEIDVALLDVNLRGEKIYPVAEMLDSRGIPFLLLSGYGNDAVPPDRPHWRACSKPFEPDDLIRILAERLAAS